MNAYPTSGWRRRLDGEIRTVVAEPCMGPSEETINAVLRFARQWAEYHAPAERPSEQPAAQPSSPRDAVSMRLRGIDHAPDGHGTCSSPGVDGSYHGTQSAEPPLPMLEDRQRNAVGGYVDQMGHGGVLMFQSTSRDDGKGGKEPQGKAGKGPDVAKRRKSTEGFKGRYH